MRFRLGQAYASLFLAVAGIASESQGVVLDVPFVPQEKNGCGAASVTMVMQYWHRALGQSTRIDVRSIHRELYSRDGHGIYASILQKYLQDSGFSSHAFKGEWNDVTHHLRKGRPLIVALKTGGGDLHYVVATGFDPQKDIMLKHDPAVRKLVKQYRAEFEAQWRGANNWTLLALPESQPVAQ